MALHQAGGCLNRLEVNVQMFATAEATRGAASCDDFAYKRDSEMVKYTY